MPYRTWKCVSTAISSGVNIPSSLNVIFYDLWILIEDRKNYLKDQYLLNSQPTFLIFTSILTQWNTILSKVRKPDNFETHNSLKLNFTNFNFFALISLNLNVYLNQTLLIFLLYVSQTWKTQVIQAVSMCERLSSFNLKGFCLICMVLQFMQRRTSFCTGLVFKKLWGFLLVFSTGPTSFSVLFLFSLLIIVPIFSLGFWCYFF